MTPRADPRGHLAGPRPARREPPGNGVVLLLGALADAGETFTRARGRRYWATAAVLLGVVQVVELARREADPVIWFFYPCALVLSLMASYPLTALARRLCGGRPWLTDATASQAVIVLAAAWLPSAVLAVLGVPALSVFLVSVVLVAVAVAGHVTLWSAAFGCPWWRAALAHLVVLAVGVAVGAALVALLSPAGH